MQSSGRLGCDVMQAPRSLLHTHRGFAEFCPTQECAPSSLLSAMTERAIASLFCAVARRY